MTIPYLTEWNGEGWVPVGAEARKRADREMVIGLRYVVDPEGSRSEASHRHFFAAVREAWLNLPEHLASEFPSDEALRKKALIHTGFRDERSIACGSEDDARRVAAFLEPMDDYAIVTVEGPLVTVYTAKSQSSRTMAKAEFQRSKEAVLGWIAQLLGVRAAEIEQNAGRAA